MVQVTANFVKTGYSRVETRRFQAMGQLKLWVNCIELVQPPPCMAMEEHQPRIVASCGRMATPLVPARAACAAAVARRRIMCWRAYTSHEGCYVTPWNGCHGTVVMERFDMEWLSWNG